MTLQRRAFTLVELLVVIAIIGVLTALLLPAIQAARESARRSQCSNNLKQVGLAMHLYHDIHGELPVAVHDDWAVFGTWQVDILPFIEQAAMYDSYDFSVSYGAVPNTRHITSKHLTTLSCPSDITAATTLGVVTSHNYAVNYGNTAVDYNPPAGYDTHQLQTFNGVSFEGAPFGQNEAFGFHDITDGTSNTLLAAEVIQGTSGDLRGFSWWGHGAIFVGWLGPNSDSPDVVYHQIYCKNTPPNPPCIAPASATNPVMMGARSRHPGGVNVAMCDARVRFASESIQLDVWRSMTSSKGGDLVDDHL